MESVLSDQALDNLQISLQQRQRMQRDADATIRNLHERIRRLDNIASRRSFVDLTDDSPLASPTRSGAATPPVAPSTSSSQRLQDLASVLQSARIAELMLIAEDRVGSRSRTEGCGFDEEDEFDDEESERVGREGEGEEEEDPETLRGSKEDRRLWGEDQRRLKEGRCDANGDEIAKSEARRRKAKMARWERPGSPPCLWLSFVVIKTQSTLQRLPHVSLSIDRSSEKEKEREGLAPLRLSQGRAGGSMNPSLSTLLEQSRRLTTSHSHSTNGGADLPQIQLGLDQIESQSRRIAGRSQKEAKGEGNAYYLLASGGVNADALSSTINTVNLTGTFEPLLPLADTDVEGYLRHTHEQTIISSIEEGRRQTTQDFYKNLDSQMRRDWERQKEKLFEELGRHQVGAGGATGAEGTPRRKGAVGFERGSPAVSKPSATSSLQMHAKMMRYDRVVRKLNEYRRQGFAFGLVSSFGEASVGVGGDSKATQIADTWRLLSHLVKERDVLNGEFQRASLSERQYAKAYLEEDQEGSDSCELRKMIGDGARQHLEEQFMSYVEKMIAARPTEAGLGGVPSIQNKIRAFLNVKYQKQGNWTNPALEIVNGAPVWAKLYYLLRSGHTKEALEFVLESERQLESLEKGFVAYFKAWLDSPDQRLPKLFRDRFLSEYNQRIRYLTNTSDPYKHALYKLIGRVEISRRNVPGVTSTTEDWLWFQLALVRETMGQGEAPHERFTLRDLAKVLVKFGEGHFDPKGTRPILYFQVLLLCGEFERAVAFLYGHSQYQVDAVHFSIALAYYGLLRVPPRSKTSETDLLSIDPISTLPSLSFSRLLHRYTRSFAQTDSNEAVNYLYLICLNADLPGKAGEEQVQICHDLVRELVMETRNYAELLGDVRNDGTKVPGLLEKDLKLLRLPSEESYLLSIVKTAANRADMEKRFPEAILLYNLAKEYDSVISVLNIELGNSLSKPSISHSNGWGQDSQGTVGIMAKGEDIAATAKSILDHYDRSAEISRQVGRKKKETCLRLMKLKEGMVLYEEGKLEQALATIESLSLIPLHSDLVAIIRSAEEFKSLDESIVRNFDIILLTTMNVIYKLHTALKESGFGDAGRMQKMMELRQKARSLMMFAGMLRYRLTSDTYAALTRLDVFIH